jgi:hypothetical protein
MSPILLFHNSDNNPILQRRAARDDGGVARKSTPQMHCCYSISCDLQISKTLVTRSWFRSPSKNFLNSSDSDLKFFKKPYFPRFVKNLSNYLYIFSYLLLFISQRALHGQMVHSSFINSLCLCHCSLKTNWTVVFAENSKLELLQIQLQIHTNQSNDIFGNISNSNIKSKCEYSNYSISKCSILLIRVSKRHMNFTFRGIK